MRAFKLIPGPEQDFDKKEYILYNRFCMVKYLLHLSANRRPLRDGRSSMT